jgi:hypothetical protein
MAQLVEPGNVNIFGSQPPQASTSREDAIIEKTKTLAFPMGPVISLENFETYGGGAGMNTINAMVDLTGKELQESYRIGFPESAMYTEKVADR